MRDLCVAVGIPMTLEDSWGGDVAKAAPQRKDGVMSASEAPGLHLREEVPGDPEVLMN